MKALRFLHFILLSAALVLNGLAPASAHAQRMDSQARTSLHMGLHCSDGLKSTATGMSPRALRLARAESNDRVHGDHAMHSVMHRSPPASVQATLAAADEHTAAGHLQPTASNEHGADSTAMGAADCGTDLPLDCCQDGSCAHSCVCQVPGVTAEFAVGRVPAAGSIIPVRAYETVLSLTGPPLLEPPIR
jgi:hypothetical protein